MTEYQRVAAEIDLDALAFNIQNIRKITSPNAGIMAVVKADAYGHGAVQISRVLLKNGADCLAVAVIEEAAQLRKNGIDAPILILGYTPEQKFHEVLENDAIQTIFNSSQAKQFSNAALNQNKAGKIHIKIDTGMGRLGFLPGEEAIEEILSISRLPGIKIDGIFTHFSTADESDKAFTRNQQQKFEFMIKALEEKGLTIPIKHAANSAGIMDFDDLCFNMVRPGIILYGWYPSEEVNHSNLELKPVMSIKSHISFLKEVEAGTPVGYGRMFVTKCKSAIATIPVGYADGFIRKMRNGGRVIINGQFAPVVGRVCMDQFMVDVTGLKGIEEGAEVVLLGEQCGLEISADEIASILDTINYEVVCMVSKRVPRVYIKNKCVEEIVNYIL